MTIYLLNTAKPPIKFILEQYGLRVWTSMRDVPSYVMATNALQTLERVDGIILEITNTNPDAQFLLAQAIILQKPTLCLYSRNREPREMLMHLSKKTIPKCIYTKAYTIQSIEECVMKFVNILRPKSLPQEIPNIKFTLRLTKSLDHYLEWLAKERNLNKAEFIRELIKRQLDEDDRYLDFGRMNQ